VTFSRGELANAKYKMKNAEYWVRSILHLKFCIPYFSFWSRSVFEIDLHK